jgi:hypothetical protein
MLTSSCATCHPSSGDTCHFRIGQTVCQKVQNCMTRGITWSRHVSCTDMPRQHCTACHVAVRPAQSASFFACLTFRTERDIFSIRTPFDEVNIPPESGRRDGRNGIGFVAFRALSFLSIFQALSGFWIRFRIKDPPQHEKVLASNVMGVNDIREPWCFPLCRPRSLIEWEMRTKIQSPFWKSVLMSTKR